MSQSLDVKLSTLNAETLNSELLLMETLLQDIRFGICHFPNDDR